MNIMHRWKLAGALSVLAITTSDAFLIPRAACRSAVRPGSLFMRNVSSDAPNNQHETPRPAALMVRCTVAISTAILTLGTVDASIAAMVPLAPAPEKILFSTPKMSSPQPTITSTSNSLCFKDFVNNAYSIDPQQNSMALSGSSVITAAASVNIASAGAVITDIHYDGQVPKTEADEYVVISNTSNSPVDISKYYVYVATTGTQGPTYYFPAGTILKPGAKVRVYTNEVHKETGGFSFEIKKAIWSNNGGLAVFKDANGKKLMEYKYKPV